MNNSSRPVLFFLPSLAGGGAQRALIQVANGFRARGVETVFLVGNLSGPYREEISEKIEIVCFRKNRVTACLPHLIYHIWKRKPRVLVSTMMHANIVSILAVKISFTKCKVVVRESNVAEVWNGKPIHEGLSVLLRIARLVYRLADRIVCVSSGVRSSLCSALQIDEAKAVVIMNPVISRELFVRSEERVDLKAIIPLSKKYVVAVGRLHKVKGFDVLLKAFVSFRRAHDFDLLILGEGPEREELMELARRYGVSSNLHMPGFVVNPYPLIKKASLFVMSSSHEGLPNALIQAIALGCRVVATNMPDGPVEILDNGHYGLVVPVGDSAAMAKAMSDVIEKHEWPTPDHKWTARFSSASVVSDYLDVCGIGDGLVSC